MTSRSTTKKAKTATKESEAQADTSAKTASKPELEVVTDTTPVAAGLPDLKKRELIQLVADRADLQKNKVKPVLEAALEVLGEAIAEGRELNLQPFGRLKINRQKDMGSARVTVAKIRQSKASAETDET